MGSHPLPALRDTALLLGSGFLQGLYAAGGPMLVAYADRESETRGSFRATLSAIWVRIPAESVQAPGL